MFGEMTRYRRIRLGQGGRYREECLEKGFVGLDYDIDVDLTGRFPADWREFNAEFVPIIVSNNPETSKVAAGLGCAAIWGLCFDLDDGDVVLAPDGSGNEIVGRIAGPYTYAEGDVLPHRRPVIWTGQVIAKSDISESMRRSIRGPLSFIHLTDYEDELAALLDPGTHRPRIHVESDDVEDPSVFALERHLEDFLVANWAQTPLAAKYKLYEEDGEVVGQQLPSDTGPIDLLAVSHDGSELLVIELKKGRASDSVIGQVQRYMGYVKEALAEDHQTVRGMIIALEDDLKIKRALSVTTNIDFYRYNVSFDLEKVD